MINLDLLHLKIFAWHGYQIKTIEKCKGSNRKLKNGSNKMQHKENVMQNNYGHGRARVVKRYNFF